MSSLKTIACALLALAPSIARAEPPCVKGAPRVVVTIDGGSAELARSLQQELASELAREKLCAVREGGGGADPVARVHIVLVEDRSAAIHIDDAITKKALDRDVRVDDLPPDGRALPIAIAADELLRASWAEITLARDTPAKQAPIPSEVRDSVKVEPPTEKKPAERPNEIGLRAAIAGYGGGQTHVGGALYFRRDFIRWLSGEIYAYGREGLSVDAPDGSIGAHAFGAGLALDANVLHAGPFRLGIEAGTEVGYVVFEGHSQTAVASSFASVTSFGLLGVVAAIDVAPIRISAAVLGLAPFRAASAMDGSETVTRVGGPGIAGTLGAGVLF